jgi:hypothetical protein
MPTLRDWQIQFFKVGTVVLLSPLVTGVIARLEAIVQMRRGPSVLQPYYDIAKLFRKETVLPEEAGPVFRAGPYVAFAGYATVPLLIPVLTTFPLTWLAIVLPAYAVLTAAVVRILLRPPVRRAPVWVSGTMLAPPSVQYTPAAYSNPIRVVLRGSYGFRRRLIAAERAGSRTSEPLTLESGIVPAFEQYLYDPATRAALRFSEQARRLQSGRLGAYLLYMLILLLVILALIPAVRD